MPKQDAVQMVKATGRLMTGSEVQSYTTVDQLVTVAQSAGLKTARFDGLEGLDAWLKAGVLVLSLGAPNGPGGYGPRHGFRETPSDMGHYIVITNFSNGVYHINDGYSSEPTEMSKSEMTAYINGDGFKGRYKLRSIAIGL